MTKLRSGVRLTSDCDYVLWSHAQNNDDTFCDKLPKLRAGWGEGGEGVIWAMPRRCFLLGDISLCISNDSKVMTKVFMVFIEIITSDKCLGYIGDN